jgi:hypothetical protein
MASKMRRTKITIEQHTITIIRQRGKQTSVYCIRCQSFVSTITPDEIAARLQISIGAVGEMARRDEIHFVETSEGNLPLVCGGLPNK